MKMNEQREKVRKKFAEHLNKLPDDVVEDMLSSMNPNVPPLTTEIDDARLKHIKQFPELIVDVMPWQFATICGVCGQDIPNIHPSLVGSMFVYKSTSAIEDAQKKLATPCCGSINSHSATDVEGMKGISYRPIPHYRIKKRLIVLSNKTVGSWPFRRKLPQGVWETVVVGSYKDKDK